MLSPSPAQPDPPAGWAKQGLPTPHLTFLSKRSNRAPRSSTITARRTHSPPPPAASALPFLSKRSHRGPNSSKYDETNPSQPPAAAPSPPRFCRNEATAYPAHENTTKRTHSPPPVPAARPPRFCRNEATEARTHRNTTIRTQSPRRPPPPDLPVSVETKPPRLQLIEIRRFETNHPVGRRPRTSPFLSKQSHRGPNSSKHDETNPLAPAGRPPPPILALPLRLRHRVQALLRPVRAAPSELRRPRRPLHQSGQSNPIPRPPP